MLLVYRSRRGACGIEESGVKCLLACQSAQFAFAIHAERAGKHRAKGCIFEMPVDVYKRQTHIKQDVLVLERIERSREAATAMRKNRARVRIDGHDGRAAEQSAVVHALTPVSYTHLTH